MLRVHMHTNDNMAFVARSKGSATGRALVVVGGILLIPQVVILLTFNIQAYQFLPYRELPSGSARTPFWFLLSSKEVLP